MVDIGVTIAGAVIVMILGTFWYSPALFGKSWMRLSGITPEKMAQAKAKGMGRTYGLAFLNALVLSGVVHYFVSFSDALTYSEAVSVGFLLWLGLVATTVMAGYLWEGKPFYLVAISAVYYLVAISLLSLLSFAAFEWLI